MHEDQQTKLNPSQRTISLPSGIDHKHGGGSDKRTSFYVQTPPSTPLGKHAPQSDLTAHLESGMGEGEVLGLNSVA